MTLHDILCCDMMLHHLSSQCISLHVAAAFKQKPYGDLAHPGLFYASAHPLAHTMQCNRMQRFLSLSFSPPSPDRRRFPPLSLPCNGVSFIA